MSRDWESQFIAWSKPPGQTEQDRCENAISVIKNAVKSSKELQTRNISVFVQGSYQNNTNVRKESDVDVGIICYDTFFYDLPQETTAEDFDITPATYDYVQFKNEVEEALVNYFGRSAIKRGNKAFDVHENTYHVEADVAPFFEHRRYTVEGTPLKGVELRPDNGKPSRVINWPDQHYSNGVNKNNNTGKRFKSLVRIFKSLCNEMSENGISESINIPGFLIECLVWNVPDSQFGSNTYTNDLYNCIVHLYNNTKTDETCSEWGEVSELKYLFRLNQKWTRQGANQFILACWNYIGFK